jgi:arsenate reductase (thioredoxin)
LSQSEQRPLKVLFVCLGNACRSQMAEAFVRHLSPSRVQAFSAGCIALGHIPPGTYAAMEEKGISLDGQWSKGLGAVPVEEMDAVVTMGAGANWPLPPTFRGRLIAWEIPDPFGGSAETFRGSRDVIEKHVRELLDEIYRSPAICGET